MRARALSLIAAAALLSLPAAALASTYKIDPNHTSVTFQIRHLFTYVEGRFRKFDGTVDFDPDHPDKTSVKGSVDVGSIDTNAAKRDAHLLGKDFFWVEKYPKITFESTGVSDVDKAKEIGKLHGNLTIRGVTKPIVLDVRFLGAGRDPWGNQKAGFEGHTTIDRKDFGLTWNQTLETGGLLLGDDVDITINAEGNLVED
jgi:polyisoprenoid-binding protein YceI